MLIADVELVVCMCRCDVGVIMFGFGADCWCGGLLFWLIAGAMFVSAAGCCLAFGEIDVFDA